jgi:hypothetical protein
MSGSGNKFDMSGSDLDVSGVTIRKDLTVNGNIYYNNMNNLVSTIEVLQDNIAMNHSDIATDIVEIKEKTDKITITSNVDLDSMNNTITTSQANTGVADKVAISVYNHNLWCYLTFANSYSGDLRVYADTNLIFNPHSNTLSTTKFAGNLSGIADSANCIKIQQVNTTSMGYLTFATITSGHRFIYCDSDLKYDSAKNILTVKAIDITGFATNSTTAAWRANNQYLRVTYLGQGGIGPNSEWNNGLANHVFRDISLRVQNTIATRFMLLSDTIIAKSAETYSDARIKMNIEDVPDTLALEQVRQLPCRYYEYKDKFKRGHGKTIGFIAQEVKEVLPMAVTTMTKFIPDHLRMAEVSWEEVDGKYLMTVSNLDTDVVSGTEIRFELNTGTPAELNEDGSVKTLASDDFSNCEKEVVMREDGKFEMDKTYDSVYIIGRLVDDFHIIDKQKIFALAFSATQELDKIQQAEKTKLAEAETKLTASEGKITLLESKLAATEQEIVTLKEQNAHILSRLSALENN